MSGCIEGGGGGLVSPQSDPIIVHLHLMLASKLHWISLVTIMSESCLEFGL